MKPGPAKIGNDEKRLQRLLNIAVNQKETKADLSAIDSDSAVNWIAVEYELQLLRIVMTGWAISYFGDEAAVSEDLSDRFWEGIQVYCGAVSAMTAPVLGTGADYFQTVRQRLDHYVQVMAHFADAADPVRVVGPTFAKLCGCQDSSEVIDLGRRVFSRCLARVQEQLMSY
jgi:hypothetical protein